MNFIYSKTKTDQEIRITYKFWPIYYILVGILIISFLTRNQEFMVITLFVIFAFILIIQTLTRKSNRLIRTVMRDKGVLVKGSRFSFKNPITYIIKK